MKCCRGGSRIRSTRSSRHCLPSPCRWCSAPLPCRRRPWSSRRSSWRTPCVSWSRRRSSPSTVSGSSSSTWKRRAGSSTRSATCTIPSTLPRLSSSATPAGRSTGSPTKCGPASSPCPPRTETSPSRSGTSSSTSSAPAPPVSSSPPTCSRAVSTSSRFPSSSTSTFPATPSATSTASVAPVVSAARVWPSTLLLRRTFTRSANWSNFTPPKSKKCPRMSLIFCKFVQKRPDAGRPGRKRLVYRCRTAACRKVDQASSSTASTVR
mmetsp:Transcript_25046/g.70104  ORF Transcript_25046/g.70104 Transcript_25046/m.70104 type:complete len:265 (+) Transcript_25046:661-1455(+)